MPKLQKPTKHLKTILNVPKPKPNEVIIKSEDGNIYVCNTKDESCEPNIGNKEEKDVLHSFVFHPSASRISEYIATKDTLAEYVWSYKGEFIDSFLLWPTGKSPEESETEGSETEGSETEGSESEGSEAEGSETEEVKTPKRTTKQSKKK